MVKQISLFLENKKGRLAHVCRVLGKADINIRGLSIADTTDFGVLRLIVNDPQRAYDILKENGFAVSITNVLAIEVADIPGGLSCALDKLEVAGVNVEYMYAFVGTTSQDALVIIRVENPESAIEYVKKAGIKVVQEDKVYSL